MRSSVRVRLEAALDRVGLREKARDVGYIVCRYICRLVGANQYRREITDVLPGFLDLQEEFFALKDDLDYSLKKNNLFRALHTLAKYAKVRSAHILEIAGKYCIDHEDLYFFYSVLPDSDLDLICSHELSDHLYTDAEILEIFKQIDHHIRTLAYRKLGFILMHDPAVENVYDLISPLKLGALRVLREYEVQGLAADHMVAMMARGVKNYAINMASSSGRMKRQKIGRVREHRELRHAYHLDVEDGNIREVVLVPDPKYRFVHEGNMLIAVQDVETDDWFIAHMKRVYETSAEASAAYQLHQAGKRSKRSAYIDPSPQQIDDFQTNVLSIERLDACTESPGLFYDTYQQEFTVDPDDSFREVDLKQQLGAKTRDFADIILNSAIDALFDEWCQQHGYDAAACTVPQLGKLACKYMGVTRADLKQELLDTPVTLWQADQQTLIAESAV